jgi:hypothetical protein
VALAIQATGIPLHVDRRTGYKEADILAEIVAPDQSGMSPEFAHAISVGDFINGEFAAAASN